MKKRFLLRIAYAICGSVSILGFVLALCITGAAFYLAAQDGGIRSVSEGTRLFLLISLDVTTIIIMAGVFGLLKFEGLLSLMRNQTNPLVTA